VIVVFGCRGGAGATTLAVTLASALAQRGKETCLVDLDILLGDVLVALDMEPKTSVTALAREAITMDGAALRRRMLHHDAGFYAVAQCGRMDDVDAELAERVPTLLDALARQFDAVVIDGLRDFGDHALAALDAADEIALVFTQDVAGVRRAARVVEVCRKLGYADGKLRLVLNRHNSRARVSLAEVERAIGLPIFGHVANDYRATQAAQDTGTVLHVARRGSRVVADVNRLAVAFVPDAPKPQRRRGFFARLFGGKA
jgi:pilus assembly protein CpaE